MPYQNGRRRAADPTNAPVSAPAGLAIHTTVRNPVDASLAALFSDAEELIASRGATDDAWLTSATDAVARAAADTDLHVLTILQESFRALSGTLVRTKRRNTADTQSVADSQYAAGQLVALIAVTDSCAELLSARAKTHRPDYEANSTLVQILRALYGQTELSNERLLDIAGKHPAQLSRACRRLNEDGLIAGRRRGRKVDWSLTVDGEEAVRALTDLPVVPSVPGVGRAEPLQPVQTPTAKSLEEAVGRQEPALSIPSSSDVSKETLWTTYRKVATAAASLEAFGSQSPPDALIETDPPVAYFRVAESVEMADAT